MVYSYYYASLKVLYSLLYEHISAKPGTSNITYFLAWGSSVFAFVFIFREFQQMAGLPVTGELNTATIRKMNMPRCGIADVIKPHDRNTPYAKMSSIRDFRIDQPLAFNAPGTSNPR